jgi:hypothetical protein
MPLLPDAAREVCLADGNFAIFRPANRRDTVEKYCNFK